MGRDYVIITDSSNDLPVGYADRGTGRRDYSNQL